MRGVRSDRCSRYAPVPQQAISDEDEGVYDESPENSQHVELLSSSGSNYNIQADVVRSNSILEEEEEDGDCVRSNHDQSVLPVQIRRPISTSSSNEDIRMSCARTACFVFSVFVCIAYVVSVLWLIPCQLVPCRSSPNSSANTSLSSPSLREWVVPYNRTRFTSRPRSVIVGRNGETIVVLAYETNYSRSLNSTSTESGVIGLRGDDGKEAWRRQFYTNVVDVLCNTTDVNGDTVPDCFVTGASGLLAAISAYDGQPFWYLHNHNDKNMRILAVSSPCPLVDMDLDGDGTEDLAVVAIFGGTNGNGSGVVDLPTFERESVATGGESNAMVILLVSGSTGQMIGRPVPFRHGTGFSFRTHSKRLSNPVLYDFGNGSRALLVSSSKRTDRNIDGVVLVLPIVDVYEEATKVSITESSTQSSSEIINYNETAIHSYVVAIYSGIGSIVSMHVISHDFERPSDVLLHTHGEEKLVFLNGSNAFRADWTFQDLLYTLSLPAFGFYDNDKVIDVFITLTPSNCTRNECNSKAIVLNGKTGQLLNEFDTVCVAFDPNVAFNGDVFLFETTGFANRTTPLSVPSFPNGNTPRGTSYTWSDVHSYSLNEELDRRPIFDKKNAVFKDPVRFEPKQASHPRLPDGVEKGTEMPVGVLAFQNRVGTIPFRIATLPEQVECDASPNMFFSAVIESNTQLMLISIQNGRNRAVVSVTDLKPNLPQENSIAALTKGG